MMSDTWTTERGREDMCMHSCTARFGAYILATESAGNLHIII